MEPAFEQLGVARDFAVNLGTALFGLREGNGSVQLKQLLLSGAAALLLLVHEGGALVVDDVTSLEGDANLATIRGRLRRFYDFSFKVQWSAKVGGRKYSGEIAYQDCSTDGDDWDEEAEARWKVPTKPSAEQRAALEPLFKHTARRSKSGLRAAIKAAVRAFEAEFDRR